MLLIIDKNTKKVLQNFGTNSMFPDGNIPNIELAENEEAIKIHDNSEMAQKILNSFDYELVIGENGLEDVKVNKTLEQHRQEEEQSPAFLTQRIREELAVLDIQVPRILEDIIGQGNFTLHQSKLDVIARKQELREQLNNL